MKSKHILYITSIILFLVPFQACDDEAFLEQNPESFNTVDNIFQSSEQVDQVLVTLYRANRDLRTQNGLMKGLGTDVLTVPDFRSGTNFSDYSRINTETGDFNTIFSHYYNLISIANTALNASELESVSWSSEEDKAYAQAQARFFRAYAHGCLAELFGGVPIVTELATEPRFDYERATREATYQYAIDELEAILNDLPETTAQDGRVVRGAAQHYLAEFYLGLGIETSDNAAFDNAILYASDVIDGGIYSLMIERFGERADEANRNVWWDLFRINNINYNDGNTECVWSLQVDFDAFLGGDDGSYLHYPRYFMPVGRAIPGVTGVAEDVGGRGVAFYRPTDLVNDLLWDASVSTNDIRNDESNIRREIYYNDPDYLDGALVGQEVPQDTIDATNDGMGWIFPIFEKLTTDQFVGLEQGENRSNLFRDDYAIRLPETILLRAEAYHRKGDDQRAANDINMIRSRANCDYLVSAGDVTIDFILDERARELFAEESRWHTLLRMGGTVAIDRIKANAYYEHVAQTLTFDFNLWPIPQAVIDRNKDVKLEQNPGWDR